MQGLAQEQDQETMLGQTNSGKLCAGNGGVMQLPVPCKGAMGDYLGC